MTEVVPGRSGSLEVGGELLRARARQLAEGSRAVATLRAYESDMADFRAWCATQHPPLQALPAEPMTVALYLAALADVRTPATIRRRISSISVVHQLAGFDSPTSDAAVQAVWKGIRRTKGTATTKKKAARTKVISALVAPLGTSLGDVRDRALLLIGFAGALRRSELVALDVQDMTHDDDGLVVTIRRSKGDQEARGDIRGLALRQPTGHLPGAGLASVA